jgi:tripartite-type tricarboxylate transporter receptor subunit TctC
MNVDSGHLITSLAVVVGVAAALAGGVQAQPFPSKPIEFNVHTAPGGGTDVFARAVSDIMGREKIFPQPLIVSNRGGGSGAVAFNYVKAKRGDPHVILTIASGSFLAAANRKELDLGLENFTPIAAFALDPQAVAVAADSKFRTIKDLIEAGRKEPNVLTAGISSATGTGRLLLSRRARHRRQIQVRLVQERLGGGGCRRRRARPLHAGKPERDAGARGEPETDGDRGHERKAPRRGAGCADHEGGRL